MIKDLKLAAYLDEAGDDITTACASLQKHKINYVVIRNSWGSNIVDTADSACAAIKSALVKNSISVVAILSEIGISQLSQLNAIQDKTLNRVFDIASYYGAAYVRFGIGTKSKEPISTDTINKWMQKITDRCMSSSVTPVLEITNETLIDGPVGIAQLLANHRRWKLLYDPAQFVTHQKQEPFSRYWTLLKSFVAAVDVRDYKVGIGFKPAGFGDSQIALTIKDIISTKHPSWLFLEPSLGRKHGSAVTRQDTFTMAMEALEIIVT